MKDIEAEAFDRVASVLVNLLGVERQKIKMSSHLVADLGADSLDLVQVSVMLEDEFGIEIDDMDFAKFARELNLSTRGSAQHGVDINTVSVFVGYILNKISSHSHPELRSDPEIRHASQHISGIHQESEVLSKFLKTPAYDAVFKRFSLSYDILYSIIRTNIPSSRLRHITTSPSIGKLDNVDKFHIFILADLHVHHFSIEDRRVSHEMSHVSDIPLEMDYVVDGGGKIVSIESKFVIVKHELNFKFTGDDGIAGAMAFTRKFMTR